MILWIKWVFPNCSFNQPAPLSVCVTDAVDKSLSIACAAAQHSSLLSYVFPCVTLVGVISATCLLRSGKSCLCKLILLFVTLMKTVAPN